MTPAIAELFRTAQPVLAPQTSDAGECALVAGDHDQAATAGVAGDQQIISADRLALAFQCRTDVSRVRGGISIERRHCQS